MENNTQHVPSAPEAPQGLAAAGPTAGPPPASTTPHQGGVRPPLPYAVAGPSYQQPPQSWGQYPQFGPQFPPNFGPWGYQTHAPASQAFLSSPGPSTSYAGHLPPCTPPIAGPSTSGAVSNVPWETLKTDARVGGPVLGSVRQAVFDPADDRCGICWESDLKEKRMLMPCKHFPFCTKCVKNMATVSGCARCPTCRRQSNDSLVVFKVKPKV